MSDQALVVARSLALAGPHDVLMIDDDGQVISASAAQNQLASRNFLPQAGFGLALGVSYSLAPLVLPLALLAGGGVWLYMRRRFAGSLGRGQMLVLQQRYDEAEEELRLALRAPLVGGKLRGWAWTVFADVARYRGRHGEALGRVRKALRLVHGQRQLAEMASLLEIGLLVDLDQAEEAGRRFSSRHRVVPSGDYGRMMHAMVELYVGMGRGEHALTEDQLAAYTQEALAMRTARAWLALLAWAHQASGDGARARELLREALAREERFPVDAAMPRLHEWIVAQGDVSRDPLDAPPP